MKNLLKSLSLIIFCFLILGLSLRGNPGNPKAEELNSNYWKDNGPLELSPDRGRFALTYSVIEDKSVHFSLPIAKFITPDLGYINGNYVSLFAPAVSYLVIPGYLIGKYLGISQVGAFAVISLFAVFNFFLLRSIAIKIGANNLAATIGSLVFLFATPAFTYAVTLYQHHISTFLILFSIYLLLRFNNLWSLAIIWFLCAASIPIDYPNIFLMFPIGVLALTRLIQTRVKKNKLDIKIKPLGFLTMFTVVLPLLFFMWFNKISYNNPLQFSGTIKSVQAIDESGKPTSSQLSDLQKSSQPLTEEKKSSISFFNPRNMLTGFYIYLFSPDRGIIFYSPVLILALFGLVSVLGKKNKFVTLLASIAVINLVLYSMWGEPYGGWAFGSRYLIPFYSIMCIFLSIALTNLSRKKLFISIFLILSTYSLATNTLGAITTSQNPPKVEAIPLSQLSGREEKYTPERNLDYLRADKSKSFLFITWFSKYLNAPQYYLLISGILIWANLILTLSLTFGKKGEIK